MANLEAIEMKLKWTEVEGINREERVNDSIPFIGPNGVEWNGMEWNGML
jgi:hypothetical protein